MVEWLEVEAAANRWNNCLARANVPNASPNLMDVAHGLHIRYLEKEISYWKGRTNFWKRKYESKQAGDDKSIEKSARIVSNRDKPTLSLNKQAVSDPKARRILKDMQGDEKKMARGLLAIGSDLPKDAGDDCREARSRPSEEDIGASGADREPVRNDKADSGGGGGYDFIRAVLG